MLRLIGAGFSVLLGILATILVISAMTTAGSSGVTTTQTMTVGPGTQAVVLDEQIVPFANTSVTITATADQEIFLGTANGIDTRNYLTGVAHQEITGVAFPGAIEYRSIGGDPLQAPAPTRDWWLESSTGTQVSHTFDLDAEPNVIIIAPAGDSADLAGVDVTMSMAVEGVFAVSLIGLACAVVAFAVAAALFVWWNNDRPQLQPKTENRQVRKFGFFSRATRGAKTGSKKKLPGRGHKTTRQTAHKTRHASTIKTMAAQSVGPQ